MTPGVLVFVSISSLAILLLPRRWAPLPFIMAACYIGIGQAIEIGPFTFTAIRILIAAGVVRVIVRRERLAGGMNGLDRWVVLWGAWCCASLLFPSTATGTFVTRLGLVYNSLGIYFLLRIFCWSVDDVVGLCRVTAILLVPLAAEMVYERAGHPSVFYQLQGTQMPLYIRAERIRAFGPFAHPILAGTIGAVSLPLMVGIWNQRRFAAIAGVLACLTMVVSSASSGPIFSVLAGVLALSMSPLRLHMRKVRWLAVAAYISLAIAMKAPVYYLIARINFVDGSTGYHRALLIESAITHLDEWWLAGTGYTRHWAPSPGPTPQHTDITNHYLGMGVVGGLPLMVLFIGTLTKAFSLVGVRLRETATSPPTQFTIWALGAALFAHTTTFLSVSYFDQSFVFIYLTLAAIGSTRAETGGAAVVSAVSVPAVWNAAVWRRLYGRPSFPSCPTSRLRWQGHNRAASR